MPFRYLTSGESHGQCLNAIIEGLPSGFKIEEDYINHHLSRRQKGYGRGGRMQIETDKVLIKSGIRFGITTGAPILLEIENKDWQNWTIPMSSSPVDLTDPSNIEKIEEKTITKVRPGHADLSGALKYNHKDVRNILERSSARETTTRVAVGAVARSILKEFGIEIFSHVIQIGQAKAGKISENYDEIKLKAEQSEARCADIEAESKMKAEIDRAKEAGDTLGGKFEIIILNAPVGLGSFVHWDRKIDALLAQAIMSIPAVKAVEIGAGTEVAELYGSNTHDEIFPKNGESAYIRKTNNAGGIEGGMTNGMPIVIKGAMKAIPTMKTPLKSIDLASGKEHSAHFERSDVCAVPACAVVAEAMAANIIVNAFLEKFGGDSLDEITTNYKNYVSMCEQR